MDTIIYLSYMNHAQNAHDAGTSKPRKAADFIKAMMRHFGGLAVKCEYNITERSFEDYRLISLEVFEPELQKARGFNLLYYVERYMRKRERRRIAKQIRQEIAPLLDDRYDICVTYHNNVPKGCWLRELLPFNEFDGYMEFKWVNILLKYAVNEHFVVLGNAQCMEEVLCGLARNMKSLLWIAPDLTYEEQLEDFAEEFFQEYGLAINLNFVPDNGTYAQMHIQDRRYTRAVNVLDFTGEKHIPFFNPPEGSVWIDMASVDEKERRIEARRIRAAYYSLKKQWRTLIDT